MHVCLYVLRCVACVLIVCVCRAALCAVEALLACTSIATVYGKFAAGIAPLLELVRFPSNICIYTLIDTHYIHSYTPYTSYKHLHSRQYIHWCAFHCYGVWQVRGRYWNYLIK